MLTKDTIAEAVRAGDAAMDRAGDFATYCHERDIDPEALSYVAMQRGLRIVLREKGIPERDWDKPVRLTMGEQLQQARYAANWMDGFTTAYTLAQERVI